MIIKAGSHMFHIVTQILFNQEIYALTRQCSNGFFCETKNLIKLLDLYKAKRDYILHTMTIN